MPFQEAAGGIHTSNLISESLVGRAMASTRQNVGTVSAVCAPGGVKAPAATSVAAVIVTVGIVNAVSSAHGVPVGAAAAIPLARTDDDATTRANNA